MSTVYEGNMPYVFISYAHRDSRTVAQIIALMERHHVRYWYDDGLHSGDDWNSVIAGHVKNAAVCLLLLSPASAKSEYVKNELNFAQTHKIPIHTLLLQDFTLPDDIEMMTGRMQRIHMTPGYEDKLIHALPSSVFVGGRPQGQRQVTYSSTPRKPAKAPRPRRSFRFPTKAIATILTICALIAAFAFVIWPNVIYPNFVFPGEPTDDLYTPELLQSYTGTYRSKNSKGEGTITFTECTPGGQVRGFFELNTDGVYGKYEISGTISEKLNRGDVTVNITAGNWVIRPEGLNALGSMQLKITKNFTLLTCSDYQIKWSTGTGSDENGIKSPQDLEKLAGSGETFYLRSDIDLTGINWTPIQDFTGILQGNGFTIRNLTIDTDASDVGFFSELKGTVMDLHFEDASVTVSGRNNNVGILCGVLSGSVSNVTVSGTVQADKCLSVGGIAGIVNTKGAYAMSNLESYASVSGKNYVGGCFGVIHDESSVGEPIELNITNCTNCGTVTASEENAGGIVGYIYAEDTLIGGSIRVTIQDCTNIGAITAPYYVGGIVGFAESDALSVIDNCSNSASITADAIVGCIAGATDNLVITNCSNANSTLTATGYYLKDGEKFAYVGGLVGYGTCLENCTNSIDIDYTGGGAYVGGLIGYLDIGPAITGASLVSDTGDAHFKKLTNNGRISGADYVGGIIGGTTYFWKNGCTKVTATFEQLINNGEVIGGGDYVGGLSGYMSGDVGGIGGSLKWVFYDCVNYNNITGVKYVAGLFGAFRNGAPDGPTYASNTVTMDGCESNGEVIAESSKGDLIGFDDIKRK